MNVTQEILKHTTLYTDHLARHARMVPFGGWEMPVQYRTGILAEYGHTRKAVGIFDTCHMGEFLIHGDCRESGLDAIVSMPLVDMPIATCRYGTMLNENGGTIDDLIVFREKAKEWFIVVNGGTTPKDAKHFCKHLKQPDVFEDISTAIGKIDVQGPLSRDVLKTLIPGIEKLAFYTFGHFKLFGQEIRVSRTGYTGELGFEIYCPTDAIFAIWRLLLENKRVQPAGLGARDVLRLEVGYSLYGHELNEDITPLEAGLQRFIDFRKEFIGKEALLRQKRQGLLRTIIGLTSATRRVPRQDQKIYAETGELIGIISSGTFSPYLQKGIGLGYIAPAQAGLHHKIYFGDDKNEAAITTRTFYPNGSLKT